jgi:hypothetical protein
LELLSSSNLGYLSRVVLGLHLVVALVSHLLRIALDLLRLLEELLRLLVYLLLLVIGILLAWLLLLLLLVIGVEPSRSLLPQSSHDYSCDLSDCSSDVTIKG